VLNTVTASPIELATADFASYSVHNLGDRPAFFRAYNGKYLFSGNVTSDFNSVFSFDPQTNRVELVMANVTRLKELVKCVAIAIPNNSSFVSLPTFVRVVTIRHMMLRFSRLQQKVMKFTLSVLLASVRLVLAAL